MLQLSEQYEARSSIKFRPLGDEGPEAHAEIGNFLGGGDADPEPPIKVLKISKTGRSDRLRLEVEICMPLAEMLARAASYFYPLIGEMEAQRAAEQRRAESERRIRERQALALKAGRLAFHRCRKVPKCKQQQVMAEIGRRFGFNVAAVAYFRKAYRKWFEARLRKRRVRTAARLYWEGRRDEEIAAYLKVSILTARRYWQLGKAANRPGRARTPEHGR